VIGWTREGIPQEPKTGCAVLISTGDDSEKWMYMGKHHARKKMIDISGRHPDAIVLNENGEGNFSVKAGSVAIWILENAKFE
jgi:alpha-amylase